MFSAASLGFTIMIGSDGISSLRPGAKSSGTYNLYAVLFLVA